MTSAEGQPRRFIANHWYFGNHYGLDFSLGVPFVDNNSSIYTYEASSTMSDKEGNLLKGFSTRERAEKAHGSIAQFVSVADGRLRWGCLAFACWIVSFFFIPDLAYFHS